MKIRCLLQKFTSCCIARDLRMLHIKMFIGNVVQKIIQTNKNGEFAGHVLAARYRNAPDEFLYTGEDEKTPVTLIRIELHSLGLGVSISPLVALVSVEWHSLGLGS